MSKLQQLRRAGVCIWLDHLSRELLDLIGQLAATEIDFVAVTDGLERQGVEAFRDSYCQLLSSIEERIASLTAEIPGGLVAQGVRS
jgi:hypothetical protein